MGHRVSIIVLTTIAFLAMAGCTVPRFTTSVRGVNIQLWQEGNLPPGYFAVLEKTTDAWRVVQISENPITGRGNSKQEVLYVDKHKTLLQPYFERPPKLWHDAEKEGYVFCPATENFDNHYDACNSNLMDLSWHVIGQNTLGIIITAGKSIGTKKYLSREKIQALLDESALLNKITEFEKEKAALAAEDHRKAVEREAEERRKAEEREAELRRLRDEQERKVIAEKERRDAECRANRARAQGFADRIMVVPTVVDSSGYYDGIRQLVAVSVDWNRDCPIELNGLSFSVKVAPVENEYSISVDPLRYEVRFTSGDNVYTLRPVVEVRSRRFESFHPNFRVKGKDGLSISIREVVPTGGNEVKIVIDLSNDSDKYIKIEALSVYLESLVKTLMGNKDELPPGTNDVMSMIIPFPPRDDSFNGLCDLRTGYVSAACADKYLVRIGAAAKYQVGNRRETLSREGGSPKIEYRLRDLVRF